MSKNPGDDWIARVYGARSNEELSSAYDRWAESYDRDLRGVGYRNIPLAAGLVGRYVAPGSGELLDAGCGTGALGEILAVLGYDDLVGIDLSTGMLEIARARGAYRDLRSMALGRRLALDDDRFVACICLGVLTAGHAPPDSLDELVRVVQPGGYLIFSLTDVALRDWGFETKLAELDERGIWARVEVSRPHRVMPDSESEGSLVSRLFVYRVS